MGVALMGCGGESESNEPCSECEMMDARTIASTGDAPLGISDESLRAVHQVCRQRHMPASKLEIIGILSLTK